MAAQDSPSAASSRLPSGGAVGGNPFLAWLTLQRELQLNAFDLDPGDLSPDERATFVTWNAYALEDELHEATDEVGWKPWATSRHFNREPFLRELTDLLHFAGNLVLLANEDDLVALADELWRYYTEKHDENQRRQDEGYDGYLDKCECGRELIGRPRMCVEHGGTRLRQPAVACDGGDLPAKASL